MKSNNPQKEVTTLSALARQYGKDIKSFKKWISFFETELYHLNPSSSNLLFPSQVTLIKKKLGEPKTRKYNYTILAKLYGVHRDTFANWMKPFEEVINRLQPVKTHDLFPIVVDYIESKIDTYHEDDRFNPFLEKARERDSEETIY
jgi:hypothetical protein